MLTWAVLVAGIDGWLTACNLGYDGQRLAQELLTDPAHWQRLVDHVERSTRARDPHLGPKLAYAIASRAHQRRRAPVGSADDMDVFLGCWEAAQAQGGFPGRGRADEDVGPSVVPELEFATVYGSVRDRAGRLLGMPVRERPWAQAIWLATAMVRSAVAHACWLVASHDPPRAGLAMRDRSDGALTARTAQFIAGQLAFGHCYCERPRGARHTWDSWDPDRFWVLAHVAQVVRGSATDALQGSSLRDEGAFYEFLTDIDIIAADRAARFVCAANHFNAGPLNRSPAQPPLEERRRRSTSRADRCELDGEKPHVRTLADTYVWGQRNAVVTLDRAGEKQPGYENFNRWWRCRVCDNLAYVPPVCPRCAAGGLVVPVPDGTPGRFAGGDYDCGVCANTAPWTFPCPWCCQTTVGPRARYTDAYTLDGATIPWDFHVSNTPDPCFEEAPGVPL